jgi:hypothetical protein
VNQHLAIEQRLHWIVPTVIAIPIMVTVLKIAIDTYVTPYSQECHTLVRHFEALDSRQSVRQGGALFVGGEQLAAWRNPPENLGEQPLLIRAHTGLTPVLAAECFERLIGFYQPATLVLWLPTDAISQPIGGLVKVIQDIRELANYYNVAPQVAIVPPIQTPRDGRAYATFGRFRSELISRTKTIPGITVWPLSDALMLRSGHVEATLFWPDGKTLYPSGYQRLITRLEQYSQGTP